jgi:hypothetical protein
MSCGASFFLAAINLRKTMIAPGRADGKSFLAAASGLKTGKTARRAITKTLKAPTLMPYFGQSPVTLGWDKTSVASRPGPVRVPDSSAPQPPGAQPTGPVEFRVRFNPLISLRAGSNAGLIFLCAEVVIPGRTQMRANPESITPVLRSMDSGPGAKAPSRNDS